MSSAEVEEGCFTLTWDIENFGLLLEAGETGFLYSPAWKVEHTGGSARRRLGALHLGSRIWFHLVLVQGSLPLNSRYEMSLISSPGEVPLDGSFSIARDDLFAMSSAEVEEGCFTLTWEIENLGLLLEARECQSLHSPVRKVEHTGGSAWGRLRADHLGSRIWFQLVFVEGGLQLSSRYEMSLISSRGEVPLEGNGLEFCIVRGALFGKKRQSIFPNGTVTLRCRILGETIRNRMVRISSVLHHVNYHWNIEKFDSSRSYDTYVEQDNILLRVFLKKRNGEETHTVILREEPSVEKSLNFLHCAISNEGGRVCVFNSKCNSPYVKWKSDIEIIPNTTSLNLQLHSIVALHKSYQDQLLPLPHQILKQENSSEAASGSCSALSDDLLALYRESALSDATLTTEGKSFPAHRSILAARSPVFRAMFEKDQMSEGRSGVVAIDDMDSETVDRMLVFLYSDSLEDVQWEEALKLFYAADKYNICPLKEKCADILKAGVAVDNACDLLVLADAHSDQELLKCVVDFLGDHQEVVSSPRWEELEGINPRLTSKITRELFLSSKKLRI